MCVPSFSLLLSLSLFIPPSLSRVLAKASDIPEKITRLVFDLIRHATSHRPRRSQESHPQADLAD